MATMAKGGLSLLLFNLLKMLSHRMTVLIITAALAVYVAWQAGSLVWKVWLLNSESPPAAALIPPSLDRTEPESLNDLLRYPLIRSESQQLAEGAATADQPKTSLNLRLVGLMYSTDKYQARAIIENQEDGARSYSIRERVTDNAEIYSIEPDRVILLHAGRQEALMLHPEQDTPSAPPDAAGQPAAGAAQDPAPGQPSADGPQRLADVMRDFSVTPVMEEGELVGYRLAAQREPALMAEWGIEPDDVITAVNGIPLNSEGKIMVLYDKLKKQREFELTLNRGGNSRTVTVGLYE